MADANRTDDVEKILTDQKALEDRRQSLINDLLQQREAAIKAFDEKLTKLGHDPNGSGKRRKSHHKQPAKPAGDAASKPKATADTSKK